MKSAQIRANPWSVEAVKLEAVAAIILQSRGGQMEDAERVEYLAQEWAAGGNAA